MAITEEQVLIVENAHKSFGENAALAGIDLALPKGECLGLLGPNGAGKTTLIRAITGRVLLDRGDIRFFGGMVEREDGAWKERIGMTPQEIALYFTLTARENLSAFGRLVGMKGKALEDAVDHALDWTGLSERADDRVGDFSGGMKRRLNIACGIVHDPEVILLDEPTAGVDPQSRQRIWDMLNELRDKGVSLLLTTHMLNVAEQVCDRIVIIDHGKVIAEGTLNELISQTIGRKRKIRLLLDHEPPAGFWKSGAEYDKNQVTFLVDEVAAELPRLLEEVNQSEYKVDDIQIEAPSLHSVFLHLTGRELRE